MRKMNHRYFVFLSLWVVLMLLSGSVWPNGVVPHSLKVLFPNGTEVIKGGSIIAIKWQSTGQSSQNKVVILLYKKGVKLAVINEQAPNTGTYSWKVSPQLPEGNDYRIRIRYLSDLAVNDFSDQNFTIVKTL